MSQPKSTPTKPTPSTPDALISVSEDCKWTENELLNLNTWIYCVCLVDFDLTEGQITKFSYPFDILSEEEKTNIANLSFPDSHTSNNDVVNAKFVFRFRARMISENKLKSHPLSGKTKISYSHRHKSHPYLFGYVYFRQKPDKSIQRGYFQKAIVIITPIPYIHVFVKAAEIIGSLYFQYKAGLKILDTACRNICSWPLPSMEGEVGLPLLGNIIRIILSPKSVPPSASILLPRNRDLSNKKQQKQKQMKSKLEEQKENGYQLVDKSVIHSSGGCFQEVNIYRYFHVVLGNLWCLWELALTGQPLLVIGSSAEECSHAVLGIMSLISPITYHGDFRPYFTIYDDDFKHFCNLHDRDMLPPLILGVTNPFFLKVMPKFPHILILSNYNSTTTTVTNVTVYSDDNINDNDNDINHNIINHIHQNNKDDEDKFIVINKAENNNNTQKKTPKDIATDKDVMTIHVKTSNTDQHQATVKKNSQRSWGPQKEVDVSKSHNTIISKSTPCLVPDDQVLSRLLTVSKATTSSGVTLNKNELEIEQVCILNNATLRKYFQQLTEKFLEPFQEYFTFKVPSGIWNPYLNPPSLKGFEKESFLNIIRDIPKSFLNEIPLRMSTLPTGKRSILVKLYSKFLKSPHFPSWFNKKRERAKRKCDKIIHKMIRKIKFERLVEGKPVREGIQMYQTIHRHMNNNNQSAKPKADLNDVLIRHRAVLRSALPSQIIEALDDQVEKMRKEQIKKRKEWQIKYRQHLKQQRAVYNLDNNSNDNDDNDHEEEITHNNFNDDSPISSPEKLSRSPSEISTTSTNISKSNLIPTPSMDDNKKRSKSDPNSKNKDKNDNEIKTKNKTKNKTKTKRKTKNKSPNKMLTSPSMNDNNNNNKNKASLTSASSVLTSPSHQNNTLSSPESIRDNKWISTSLNDDNNDNNNDNKTKSAEIGNNNHSDNSKSMSNLNVNDNVLNENQKKTKEISKKVKKKKKVKSTHSSIFDHSTPSIFTSALSMGAGLSGGLAPNIHHNIHKYHRYNKSDDNNMRRKRYQSYKRQERIKKNNNNQGGNSYDETMYNKTKTTETTKTKKINGGASSFDETIKISSYKQYQRQRASSTESIQSISSSTATSPIRIYNVHNNNKWSKDDNYTTHYKYNMNNYAGIMNKTINKKKKKRRRKSTFSARNNSPKMTNNLFDLSNLNDFVSPNEAKAVVTNSFTSAHDDNFKVFDNHF